MMRILHFADLHLGVETYGRIDPGTGLSSRLHDFLNALDKLVDYAIEAQVDLVLFCGDAYKSRDPSQTSQREFAKRVSRLTSGGVPLFLLAGNHDLPHAVGRATSVEIFDTLSVDKVTVANQPGTYRIETKSGTLQVIGLPWARRGKLLTREEARNLSPDQINERMQEILTQWLNAEVQNLDPALPAVLAAHLAHSGAVTGSEKTMLMGRDYVLHQSTLANTAFDYVALGHMHNRQKVDYPVPVVYPGSLQAIDFGDEGQDKGFYLADLDEGAAAGKRLKSHEFRAVESRRFLTIKVDANADDPTDTVLEAIAQHDVEGAIVRVLITITGDRADQLRESEIRKALKEAYFVAAVSREVEQESRSRLGAHSVEAVTPLEALELYLDSKSVPQDRARTLLEYGEKLIQESLAPE